MLESLDQLNIQRMAVENETHQEDIFNPDTDLTLEDREALKKSFGDGDVPVWHERKGWAAFAVGLKNLLPEYKLAVEKTARQLMQHHFINHPNEFFNPNLASFLADVREIYPKFNTTLLPQFKAEWSKYLEDPKTHKRADFVIIMDAMKRLGLSDEEIGLNQEVHKTAMELLNDPAFVGNEYLQIRMAAGIKRLWPNRPLKLDQSMVEDWRRDLERQRQENYWQMFTEMASEMMSLNPRQTEELNNNQSIPEQRSF